jgi:hypothetical protein
VEGGLGFLFSALSIIAVPFNYKTLEDLVGHPYPHSAALLYLTGSVNLIFEVMLVVAGVLLWKLQRRGLLLLICVLIAEFISVLGIMAIFAPRGQSKALGFIMGMGLMPFALQIVTGFPIVAGILIFFAYRYLGIPARAIE